MADADAPLIRKFIVAAFEGGDTHTALGTIRYALSDFYLADERATGRPYHLLGLLAVARLAEISTPGEAPIPSPAWPICANSPPG